MGISRWLTAVTANERAQNGFPPTNQRLLICKMSIEFPAWSESFSLQVVKGFLMGATMICHSSATATVMSNVFGQRTSCLYTTKRTNIIDFF